MIWQSREKTADNSSPFFMVDRKYTPCGTTRTRVSLTITRIDTQNLVAFSIETVLGIQ